MQFRHLLRKRFHVRVGLVDPSLPSVQAQADEAPRGFVTPSLGNILSVAGLSITLIGGYVNLRTSQQSESEGLKIRVAALEKGRADDHDDTTRQFTALRTRFNGEVVSRPEIESRFGAVQAWQMQVNGLLLDKAAH